MTAQCLKSSVIFRSSTFDNNRGHRQTRTTCSTAKTLCKSDAYGFGFAAKQADIQKAAREVRARDGAYGASGTSFYTTTEKQETYDSLDTVLDAKCRDTQVRKVIVEMLEAVADITEALRSALVTVEGSSNTFGDAQLSVDVIADEIMWAACRDSAVVAYGASEEEPEVRACNPNGEFTVCWDPLDGSSIVDNNWAVGTMIGVWGSKSGTGADGLIGATGRDQKTSLVALYGPRTTVLVALDDGVYEFSYGCTPEGCQLSDGSYEPWICSRHQIKIDEDCKIFAPANLRAAKEVEGYKKLIDHYMDNKYTLRYSGGLVPDVYQQFTKQQGVFSNPTSDSSPAKLRLAFEAAPFGLLVELAGGKTSDGVSGRSVLDVQINAVDQRTALCIGSANEVDRFNDMICVVDSSTWDEPPPAAAPAPRAAPVAAAPAAGDYAGLSPAQIEFMERRKAERGY